MVSTPPDDDPVFKALAHRDRRSILDLLRERPHTTGELAERFATSRFAVMKHLDVLEEAGLLLVERQGRTRINHLDPVPIQAIHRRWIQPFEAVHADRLLRIKLAAEANDPRGGPDDDPKD